MKYMIIGDSCLDMPAEYKHDPRIKCVPLTLEVGDVRIIDDEEHFDQKEFLDLIKKSPECPKTACPSPQAFMEAMDCDADMVFVICLSGQLSGSYNSALVGKGMYEEEINKHPVHVIDSYSASSGEANIALEIIKYADMGLSFEEICEKVDAYRDDMKTYFVLETLDILKKNGRLTGMAALIASTLGIKPIMDAKLGVIYKRDQARGISKALDKMCDLALKEMGDMSNGRIIISHVNNVERAEKVKELLLSKAPVKEIQFVDTQGVATIYAADGGIIITGSPLG